MKYNKILCYTSFILIGLIIVIFYLKGCNDTENFTPTIKRLYRPHIRNIRTVTESFYNKNNLRLNNLLTKFGVI
jgi:hypothetical protein